MGTGFRFFRRVRPLEEGLDGWVEAGYTVEGTEIDEIYMNLEPA